MGKNKSYHMQNLKQSLEDLLKEGEFLPDDSDVNIDEDCINAVDEEDESDHDEILFAGQKNEDSPKTEA